MPTKQATPATSTRILPARPAMTFPLLPVFDSSDLNLVRRMFQTVPHQPMAQSWLEAEESDFTPGSVRTAWRGSSLLIFAELADLDIFNDAIGPDQRVWELGDTLEIFIRPDGWSEYFEFQITPENHTLQLRFADAVALENLRRNDSMEPVLKRSKAFRSRTWIQSDVKSWYVYAEIDATVLGEPPGPLQGRQWWISFSRYDYTRGRAEPVISSTSPHAEPDFHRHHEWAIAKFSRSAVIPVED